MSEVAESTELPESLRKALAQELADANLKEEVPYERVRNLVYMAGLFPIEAMPYLKATSENDSDAAVRQVAAELADKVLLKWRPRVSGLVI